MHAPDPANPRVAARDHPTDPDRHSDEHARQIVGVQDVAVGYAGRAVLPAISVCLHEGELWALVGRNGAGKSTVMRTLLGLQPVISGHVQTGRGVRVAYVRQEAAHQHNAPCRVRDFVEAGLDVGWSFLRPWLTSAQQATVDKALAEVELQALVQRPVETLSQGQLQRARIARALATEPQLLVLDEPTSAMDPMGERATFELLRRIARDRRIAVLVSSHHMSFLPEYADHALLVDRDLDIAVGGGLREVFWSDAFRSIYGDLHVGIPEDDGCAH